MPKYPTANKPTRRTFITGETLPEITDGFRPIDLGLDSQGNPDGQIRAFAVNIRNRSDTTIEVKENESSDPATIDRFESYNIWEPNGISRVFLKGESGGERAEIRVLVAHNDFDVADKIEAFVRSISHFLSQGKTETVITDSETTFDVQGNVTIDDITTGTVSIDSITDSVDIASGTVDIGQIADGIEVTSGTVTIGDITGQTQNLTVDGAVSIDDITGQTQDLTIDGAVEIDDITGQTQALDIGGNVTVDDIQAANAQFDGDITGQSDFDVSVLDRTGKREMRYLADTNGYGLTSTWEIISNAGFDGMVEYVLFRAYDDSQNPIRLVGPAVDITNESGNYQRVSPRSFNSVESAQKFSNEEGTDVSVAYDTGKEVVFRFEPKQPLTFVQGDSVRIRVGDDPAFNFSANDIYEVEIEVAIRKKLRNTQA